MDLTEFRESCLEILANKGLLHQAGETFYPESALIELLDYIHLQLGLEKEIQVIDVEGMICDTIDRAFQKLREQGTP